jgi:hypothetical protein
MSGDDDVVGAEIETLISFVISGVSEKDTMTVPAGPICEQLVRRGWDSRRSRTRSSAHTRVRHHREQHTGRRC